MRPGLVTALLIIAFCCVPEHAPAALNDQYPTDPDGVLVDPEISALAETITGRAYTIECTPPNPDFFGSTNFTGEQHENGSITWFSPSSSQINGDLCGALDKVLHFSPAWFKHDELRPVPLKRPARRVSLARLIDETYVNERTATAGVAILTLVHEAIHAQLAPAPFEDDGDDSNGMPDPFNEGLVECLTVRNVWSTIKTLSVPAWFKRNLYIAAVQAHQAEPDDYRTIC